MMNKIETTVRILIACLIAGSIPLVASAEATADGEKTDISHNGCPKQFEEKIKAENLLNAETAKSDADSKKIEALAKSAAERARDYDNCIGTNVNNEGDCSKSQGQYNTARGALSGACLTLGGGNSGEPGWPLCTKAIVQCDVCPSESEEMSDRRSELSCQDTALEEEEYASEETPDAAFGLRNLMTGKQLLKYCPGKLGSEQKELEKQMNEAQKETRRLESELPKKQAEYAALVAKGEEDMLSSQEKMTSAQSEIDNQMLELQNSQDDAIKGITEQIRQSEEQIRRVDDSIRQVELSKVDVQNSYDEQIKQIHLNCHASAVQSTSKLQQDRLQLERAKLSSGASFNSKSFHSMMRNIGVTNRTQWQRVADKYYNWCLQSKATKDSEGSALRARDSALAKAQEAIAKLERDKESLRQQITTMKDRGGCGQPGQQASDMCRAIQKFQRQAESYSRQYNTKMNQANSEMATKQRANATEQQAKMAEATLIQQQLAEERTRLTNLKEYLELAYQAGGGMTSGEAKNYVEARNKFGEFVAAASIYTSCRSQSECGADTMCSQAAEFLNNYGAPPSYSDSASDKPGDATKDPVLPSTGTPSPDSGKPTTKETEGVRETKEIYPDQL